MVKQLNSKHAQRIQQKLDNKTKPLGALGELEALAHKLVSIQSQGLTIAEFSKHRFVIKSPHLLIYAGDHGIAQEGVSIAPSEVTGQMISNFVNGGAAVSVLCKELGWSQHVIDCGTLGPYSQNNVIDQRLGSITAPFHQLPAMTEEQLNEGLKIGRVPVDRLAEEGADILAFGEMGIGNSSAAAAIFAAITGMSPSDTVGAGTGISPLIQNKKRALIEDALQLHRGRSAYDILRCFGGFEIVQIVSGMLAAAEHKLPILVDGFIVTAAAMLAIKIEPNSQDYMIFAHCSDEQGHKKMLDELGVRPLFNLSMRLGEGSGAALALPIVCSALAIFNDMASFEAANVTNVVNA